MPTKKNCSDSQRTMPKGKTPAKQSANPLCNEGEEEAMECSLEHMSVERFKLWTPHALKIFLNLRGKSAKGEFDELVYRAFYAWEEKAVIEPKSEAYLRRNLEDYKNKLKLVDGNPLPDPFTLNTAWYDESDMDKWPSLYFVDIASFLKLTTPTDLYHKLCNEYKVGKGYRYFTDNHIGKGGVHYHEIHPDSDVAYLCARIKPSMKSSSPYQAWVLVEKDTESKVGGRILTGYCTCIAGLYGACNHVAALLFRVEYFVRIGKTRPACTSKLSAWNVPRGGGNLEDFEKPLCELLIKKDQYSAHYEDDHQKSVRDLANVFSPLSAQEEEFAKTAASIEQFAKGFRQVSTESTFVQMHFKIPFKKPVPPECPPSPIELAKSLDVLYPITNETLNEVRSKFVLTAEERENIQILTMTQSDSDIWLEQRKARVTASIMRQVHTRVNTLLKDKTADPTNIIMLVMGHDKRDISGLKQIKHGSSMEPHAKRAILKLLRPTHKKFVVHECGLVIHPEFYCIGGSPDLITECLCHGKWLCEIKCPESIKDQIPTHANYSHLENDPITKKSKLKMTSPYYAQIQTQLAVTGLKFSYFFVFTHHGFHIETVEFDEAEWDKYLITARYFWNTYILRELFEGNYAKPQSNVQPYGVLVDHNYGMVPYSVKRARLDPKMKPTKAISKTVKGKAKSQVEDMRPGPVLTKPGQDLTYLCGQCGLDCENVVKDFGLGSVMCDICKRFYHFACAGITKDTVPTNDIDWYCDGCLVYIDVDID